MAAYISVPRDLTKVKSKVAFNLTKRQLLCFGTAALIGVPLFFVLRDSGGNTAATLGMMAVMLPAFFLGMYEKNGQPLEKLLSHYVQARFLCDPLRRGRRAAVFRKCHSAVCGPFPHRSGTLPHYEVKRGKYTSVKGARQKRFIRFRTLGAGYSEEELKAVLAGEAEHRPRQKSPAPEQKFQMLVDIQAKLAEGKGAGFARWAKQHNLKEMSRTLVFLQENKIGSIEEMQERVDVATARYHELGDSIKASEKRLAEIAVLKAHIINYAKTRPVYDAYRKNGYSKRFLETHRTEITLHKAAKAAFDESNLKKLPKVKELDAEYSKLLTEKKARYPDYRKAKEEMQELLRAQKNIELFFDEEKNPKQTEHSR